jgi:hypothetical protein
MKSLLTILLMTTFLFSKAQSFEMISKDTINMIDANAKKQGKWIITGRNKPGTCYGIQQTIEEGMYKDNKRIGIWKEYYCNNNMKSKMNYVNGRPTGEVILYYENGRVREEGTWTNNRWVGKYIYVNETGDITEFVFDDKGKEVSKKITPAKKTIPSNKK